MSKTTEDVDKEAVKDVNKKANKAVDKEAVTAVEKEKVKNCIAAIIAANPIETLLTMTRLNNSYKEKTGIFIPYYRLGYQNLGQLLNDIPDVEIYKIGNKSCVRRCGIENTLDPKLYDTKGKQKIKFKLERKPKVIKPTRHIKNEGNCQPSVVNGEKPPLKFTSKVARIKKKSTFPKKITKAALPKKVSEVTKAASKPRPSQNLKLTSSIPQSGPKTCVPTVGTTPIYNTLQKSKLQYPSQSATIHSSYSFPNASTSTRRKLNRKNIKSLQLDLEDKEELNFKGDLINKLHNKESENLEIEKMRLSLVNRLKDMRLARKGTNADKDKNKSKDRGRSTRKKSESGSSSSDSSRSSSDSSSSSGSKSSSSSSSGSTSRSSSTSSDSSSSRHHNRGRAKQRSQSKQTASRKSVEKDRKGKGKEKESDEKVKGGEKEKDSKSKASSAADKKSERHRSRSRSKSSHRKKRHRSPTPRPTKIHIGRLTRTVNRDHIYEIFGTYGVIKNVEYPKDHIHTHIGRGYAYVEYSNADEAENAMKHMDGGQIDGQEITAAPVLLPKSRSYVPRRSPIPARRPPARRSRFRRRTPARTSRRTPPRRRARSRNTPARRRKRSRSSSSSSR